jgi:hypothetical protein
MKTIALAFAAATMTLTGLAATPALADPPAHAKAYGKRAKDRIYDDRGRYLEPRRIDRDDRIWRGEDGRYYCSVTTARRASSSVPVSARWLDTRSPDAETRRWARSSAVPPVR